MITTHLVAAVALFPPNGLDRSLHVAVLVGLVIGTLFTESFGWPFAGLVVPGYLATVFIAAPVTGMAVVIEAVATYVLVAAVGKWIAATGAWSAAFGRERFFLFIVGAVLVRVGFDGAFLPWLGARYGFAHSRELYSLGLVLVPLLANMFWNTGILHGGPRVAVMTGLTYLIVEYLLLPYTNLSVARFQMVNESVALEFLQSPKAHIILVAGALLGARNNILYGWDYNGILVPGLLAVAWYEPTKLVTTCAEALVVYGLARGLTSFGPLSRALIVGPRRMLFAYFIGFAVKVVLGFGMARFAPGVQMIDYYGFGYLLPTLLAVKMWNKDRIGIVLMPTLQVSFVAFLAGNAAGYAIAALPERWSGIVAGVRGWGLPDDPASQCVRESGSIPFELLLGDVVERPLPPDRGAPGATDAALRVAADVHAGRSPDAASLRDAAEAGLDVARSGDERAWYAVTPREADPDDARMAPRAAFRRSAEGAPSWVIAVAPDRVGSALAAVGYRAAEVLGASSLVLLARDPAARREDELLVERLLVLNAPAQLLLVEARDGSASETSELSVVGSLPRGLDAMGLERALGASASLRWRAASGLAPRFGDAPRLVVPRGTAEAVGAALLGAPDVEGWARPLRVELPHRMHGLTSVGSAGFVGPSLAELRLFSAVLAPRMIAPAGPIDPSPWERALAARLGYRFARVGAAAAPEAWALFESGDPRPEGSPAQPTGHGEAPQPTEDAGPSGAADASPSTADAGPGSAEAAEEVSWQPPGPRRGHPTLITRARPPGGEPRRLGIELPAPRWERGTLGAALAFFRALDADVLMIAGAMPNADPTGAADTRRSESRRSYYQRAHELWLGAGGTMISLQGLAPDRAPGDTETDVGSGPGHSVVTFGQEVLAGDGERTADPQPAGSSLPAASSSATSPPPAGASAPVGAGTPPWSVPMLELLGDAGIGFGFFDGSRARAAFSGSSDVAMSYAKRYARGRFAILYLDDPVRSAFAATEQEEGQRARLGRLGVRVTEVDVAQRGATLAECTETASRAGSCADVAPGAESCDLDAATSLFWLYKEQHNPFDLRAATAKAAAPGPWAPASYPRAGCHIEIDKDTVSGGLWAVVAGRGEARLVSLGRAARTGPTPPIPTAARARRAVDLEIAMVRVRR